MHKMFYANTIFSLLHAKSEEDLKNAEMTTNKCVYGKITKNKSCPKKLRKSWKKEIKKIKKNTKTDKNFTRNTTDEENNPVIKREISRSGDQTCYKNN